MALHLLGEAQGAGKVMIDPLPEHVGAPSAGSLDPPLASQLAKGMAHGDQAAAVAGGQLALGGKPIALVPGAGVEHGTQVKVDLVMQRDWSSLEPVPRHRPSSSS